MARCGATRKDGQPCTQPAQSARGFCWGHRPDLVELRRAASARGGANKATGKRLERRMPASLRPILNVLYGALTGLDEGTTDAKTATAMAATASAIARIYEVAEMDSRLAALESHRERHAGRNTG